MLDEFYNNLLLAIVDEQIGDYIRGINGYMVEDPNPVGPPPIVGEDNYFYGVYKYGFVRYHSEHPRDNIGNTLLETLSSMLNTDSTYDLYCCCCVIGLMLNDNYRYSLGVDKTALENLLLRLKNVLSTRQEELRTTKTSDGIDYYGLIQAEDEELYGTTGKHFF